MKVLIVVDMQNDFIDGALGTKEAEAIVDNVVEEIKGFRGKLIYTRDTHNADYLNTQEGKKLPIKHCIKGTDGWQINKKIIDARHDDVTIIDKGTFGSISLPSIINTIGNVDEVELIGLCTDICVISNAMLLKAHFPEMQIVVNAKCCAGVTPQSHKNALEAMKMCQIDVINEDD